MAWRPGLILWVFVVMVQAVRTSGPSPAELTPTSDSLPYDDVSTDRGKRMALSSSTMSQKRSILPWSAPADLDGGLSDWHEDSDTTYTQSNELDLWRTSSHLPYSVRNSRIGTHRRPVVPRRRPVRPWQRPVGPRPRPTGPRRRPTGPRRRPTGPRRRPVGPRRRPAGPRRRPVGPRRRPVGPRRRPGGPRRRPGGPRRRPVGPRRRPVGPRRRLPFPDRKMLPLLFKFPGSGTHVGQFRPRHRRPSGPPPSVKQLMTKNIQELLKLVESYTGGSVMGDELMVVSDPIQVPSPTRMRQLVKLAGETNFKDLEAAAGRRIDRGLKMNRQFQGRDSREGYSGRQGLAANNRPTAESTQVNGLGLQSIAVFREVTKALNLTREEIRFVYHLTRGAAGGDQDISVLKVLLSLFRGFDCPFRQSMFTCDPTSRYRSISGSCNNLKNPTWGMASTAFRRFLFPRYADVIGEPFKETTFSGLPQVSPRTISRVVHTRAKPSEDKAKEAGSNSLNDNISHMVMQFGQFIDHDITLAPDARDESGEHPPSCCAEDGDENGDVPDNPIVRQEIQNVLNLREECNIIPISPGDPKFSPRRCMSHIRSQVAPVDSCQIGVREQVNALTSYVDASMIYGSDEKTAKRLRESSGGCLASQQEERQTLLPLVSKSDACVVNTTKPKEACFEAGDGRVNEHPGLASMHTMFMREHNRLAVELAKINPMWNDETLYQEARKIVGAIVQHILYADDLKILLGPEQYSKYRLAPQPKGQFFSGYNPKTDGSIRNDFATSAYRFGHTLIRDSFSRLSSSGRSIPDLELSAKFNNPQPLYSDGGPDSILRGLVKDRARPYDRFITAAVTEHLFEPLAKTAKDAFDLMALNMNRGRDHGLESYVSYRKAFGLSVPRSFDELYDHDAASVAALKEVYTCVEDVEAFTGGISETSVKDGLLGPLFSRMTGRQFQLTKEGDRFWYETNNPTTGFTIEQLDEIRKVSLSRLLCDNVNMRRMQVNAFLLPHPSENPVVSCDEFRIPSIDLTKWRDCQEPMWGQWSSWSQCCRGYRERIRRCVTSERGCGEERRCKGYNRGFIRCRCHGGCRMDCSRHWNS